MCTVPTSLNLTYPTHSGLPTRITA